MRQILILTSVVLWMACSSSTNNEELTAYEKLQGTWGVTNATIDGQYQPVTAIGLGQMRAIFEDYDFYYVYPELNESGMPTSETDTVAGIWTISEDEATLTITDKTGTYTLMVWTMQKLLVGTFAAEYTAQSASGTGTSTYSMTYNLK